MHVMYIIKSWKPSSADPVKVIVNLFSYGKKGS